MGINGDFVARGVSFIEKLFLVLFEQKFLALCERVCRNKSKGKLSIAEEVLKVLGKWRLSGNSGVARGF